MDFDPDDIDLIPRCGLVGTYHADPSPFIDNLEEVIFPELKELYLVQTNQGKIGVILPLIFSNLLKEHEVYHSDLYSEKGCQIFFDDLNIAKKVLKDTWLWNDNIIDEDIETKNESEFKNDAGSIIKLQCDKKEFYKVNTQYGYGFIKKDHLNSLLSKIYG